MAPNRYCWTVRRVFSLWLYSESSFTKIWTITLSFGVTIACLYGSYLSPQWRVALSSSVASSSPLRTEDALVLAALAFNVSCVTKRLAYHYHHHHHYHHHPASHTPQIVFVFGIEMLYLNAQLTQDKKRKTPPIDLPQPPPLPAVDARSARSSKRATSPRA